MIRQMSNLADHFFVGHEMRRHPRGDALSRLFMLPIDIEPAVVFVG